MMKTGFESGMLVCPNHVLPTSELKCKTKIYGKRVFKAKQIKETKQNDDSNTVFRSKYYLLNNA